MNDVPNLGGLCNVDAKRDAVHIAVCPLIAGEDLYPGEHIGLGPNNEALSMGVTFIGIADPFLNAQILKGQRFWLFLYPNTVTSLRHVWTHPAFKAVLPNKEYNS